MAGLSDTLSVIETEEKCKRKKERKKERTKHFAVIQQRNVVVWERRRKLRHRHNFYTLPQSNALHHLPFPPLHPQPLRFFETRPFLVSRLENPIIQTQRASSSKLVETDPVFVADGHEVCRVVLLRELCKCRT